ncbi:MAG TPA: hypothetical protein VMT62_16730 [Syntrophorhabdaceae bacterium]|nr:hypothetical protein [Syntrophorhabdaceae bacterium]
MIRIITEASTPLFLAERVMSFLAVYCTRFLYVLHDLVLKNMTQRRFLWDVFYQVQLSLVLQQSLWVLSLCLARQVILALRNDWRTNNTVSIRSSEADN